MEYNNEPELYAVYGTLMSGFGNHRLLSSQSKENDFSNLHSGVEFVGNDVTSEKFDMFDIGFPGIVPNEKGTGVHIEVYSVSSPQIKHRLDMLEGHHRATNTGMYKCQKVKTKHGDAWIYVWNGRTDGLRKIESGNFRDKYKTQ